MFVLFKVFFLLVFGITSSFASGFQLYEGNAINISDFGAGGGANLKDASATFFNPAALTNLQCQQIVIAGTAVLKKSKFNGDSNIETISRSTGVAVPTARDVASNTTVKSKGNSVIPAIFYGTPINNKFALGLGISVPFGLSTDWGENSAVRYSASKTRIKTINFGPSVSYKINDSFIIGGGIDVQYLNAELHSTIATSTETANLLNVSSQKDSYSKSSANGFGAGGNIGILLKFIDRIDFSLHYRSRIDHNISGRSEFTGELARDSRVITSDSSTRLTLPDIISCNGVYTFTDKIKLLAGVYYTTWSTLKSITMQNIASPSGPVTEDIKLKFRNTWRFSLGTQFNLNDKVTLRGGLGYDQGSVREQNRSLRSPDNDRIGIAVGGRYKLNKMFIFDFGYTHIFIRKANIDHKTATNSQNSYVKGTVKNNVNLFALQVTTNFC
ncbi:MAG: outer membrane protein transport protein [Legionellales bacterium]|nr:outer membrane protein transport protein [Legionellales bacterium]